MKDAFQDGIPLDYNGEMLRLNDEINKASDELAMKVAQIDGDIITARNNPEIRNAWNRLCRLHMKAMVSCTYDPIHQESIAKLCEELSLTCEPASNYSNYLKNKHVVPDS